jgi:excisionase family DNA binding protein
MTIQDNHAPPLAHRIPDACRRLGIGRSTMYELFKSGEIRPIKIGARSLVLETDLQRVIAVRLGVAA